MDKTVTDNGSPYSKAFDNLVEDDDDVVGLLAYALYKQAIREEAIQGSTGDNASRNPPPTLVKTYRQAAERKLEQIVEDSIDRATPEIQESAVLDKIQQFETHIVGHVTKRTSAATAIVLGVVTWLISILLTIAILHYIQGPDLIKTIEHAGSSGEKAVSPNR